MPDDYTSDTQTTGTVAVDGSATGEIETSNDFDWFAVDLVAGHTYVIDLEGADSGGGALQDPVLRGLYDVDGNRIAGARDNDGGAGRDARLTFTAATTGAYYIEARGHSNQTGDYTVRVTEWVDTDAERGGATDLGDITELAGPQFPAASLDGSSDSVDYWRFTLSEARRVGLGLRQQDANADLFLEDAEGNVLYSGTEEGTASEWISQTLPAGTYFVRVEAQEEGANEFKLRYGVSAANPDVVAALEQQQQGTDEAPEFAQPSYAFDLAENADGGAIGVALGAVSAADPEDETITYSIEAGDSGGLFAIDSETGALSYHGAGEDYESGATSYELTVRASDGTNATDTIVTVNVTDLQEPEEVEPLVTQSEQSTPQTVSEPAGEDLPTNTSTIGRVAVGGTATGKIGSTGDRDGFAVELVAGRTYIIDLRGSPTGDGTLDDPYLRGIKGPDGRRIAGVSNDDGGEGYNSQLNFTPTESGTHYIIAGAYSGLGAYEVEVRDVSPQTAQQKTVNGPPAFGQTSYEFTLAENADGGANGVSLGAVSATDPEDSTITYSIEAGDSDGLFAIDSETGALSYQGAGEDYESETRGYELTVRASDGGLHSDVTVAVNVTDVAEAPAFGQENYAFSLTENAEGDTIRLSLGRVSAADPDDDPVDYSIVAGNGAGLFELDAQTGDLFYVGSGEDYESGSTRFELTVRASDGNLFSDATMTIDVTDVPEQEATETQQSVSEPDGQDLPEGASTAGRIAVGDFARGELETSGALDHDGDRDWFAVELEAGKRYRIDLEGYDTGAGTLSDPYLRGVHDADGVLIPGTENYADGVGCNSRVAFTAEEDATYYVAAGSRMYYLASRGWVFHEGTYKLSVTDITDSVPDDFADTTQTTGEVEVDGSATGEIEVGGDRDWFAVELDAGSTYQIELEGLHTWAGTLYDPYLHGVHDADGDLIAGTTNNNGGPGGLNSQVRFTAEEAGTYYVAAGGNANRDGTYRLSVVDVTDGYPDDFEAGTGTRGVVEVDGSATGEIEEAGDHDWFAVELDAGKKYMIDLEGRHTRAGTLGNPYLHGLRDADGVYIAGTARDDGAAGRNSRSIFTVAEDGDYYLVAGGYGFLEGTYTLSVTDVTDGFPDDFSAGTRRSGTVAVGGSATGDVELGGDRDWFAVTLEAGTTYQIDLEGFRTGAGTLWDTYLYGVHDADGNRLPGTRDDDGGVGVNSRVEFTPVDAGIYYVAAGAFGNQEGTYTLSVEEVM